MCTSIFTYIQHTAPSHPHGWFFIPFLEPPCPLSLSALRVHSALAAPTARWLRRTVRARGCRSLTSMGLLDSRSLKISSSGCGFWQKSQWGPMVRKMGDLPSYCLMGYYKCCMPGYNGILWKLINNMGYLAGIRTNKWVSTSNGLSMFKQVYFADNWDRMGCWWNISPIQIQLIFGSVWKKCRIPRFARNTDGAQWW